MLTALLLLALGDDLRVFPAEVELSSSRDRQSFVVQRVRPDGVTLDVTGEAKVAFADASLVRREGNILFPAKDGATEMTVSLDGTSVKVRVAVKGAAQERPIRFTLDVMPIFMRAGCNSGACHGAARGKDGFMLSLFGYDPDGDHFRLTRQQPGRRVSTALAEECLLVEKSTGTVQHTGGDRIKRHSELHATLLRWLEAGAPNDPPDTAKPVSLEIMPDRIVLEGEGATQRVTVRAKYSDGTDRDVTSLALFMSSNDPTAKIAEDGGVTAGRRGEAYVFARFATFTEGAQVLVIPKGATAVDPRLPARNYVDEAVFAKLRTLRMVPSGLCDDGTFLRRATLDITGLLPTREETERFIADTAADKRARKVDELLERKEFVELWVMRWAELLQIRSDNQGRMSYKATVNYFNWLQEKIAANVPFDEMVRELLSATGGAFQNPATNFYNVERDTLKLAENVAQVFMGMRIQCAQCHNHPFDRWTMDDYYGFAAFFSQIGRKNGEDPRERIVFDQGRGGVKHPLGGRDVPPKFLGGEQPDLQGRDRREVLAEWLASPRNPYFAKNLANLVWAHFFGRGIVEPVDDVRISNPPSNPELLDALAKRFTEVRYDLKTLVRDICNSSVYQLSTRPNETNELDDGNFARAGVRRLRAELLLDVVSQVTETPNKFRGLPLGARAVQIADGRTTDYFLMTFGRASRETVCSCEVKMEPNLSQALHLLNGQTSNQRIQQGGLIKRLLAEKKAPEEILDELFLRCLARRPTEAERAKLLPSIDPKNLQTDLEDVFWAILNSNEFIFNH